jgi:hypothetical protein
MMVMMIMLDSTFVLYLIWKSGSNCASAILDKLSCFGPVEIEMNVASTIEKASTTKRCRRVTTPYESGVVNHIKSKLETEFCSRKSPRTSQVSTSSLWLS